jgi:hypothetical protein
MLQKCIKKYEINVENVSKFESEEIKKAFEN